MEFEENASLIKLKQARSSGRTKPAIPRPAGVSNTPHAQNYATQQRPPVSSGSGSGGKIGIFAAVAAAAVGAFMFFGGEEPQSKAQRNIAQEASPPPAATEQKLAAGTILLRVTTEPTGTDAVIEINGNPVSVVNPTAAVPLDSPLEVSVKRPGFMPFHQEFVLSSAQYAGQPEATVHAALQSTPVGIVTIRTTPSADVIIHMNGKDEVFHPPFVNQSVPVGRYKVRLVNEALNMEKTIELNVEKDRREEIDERLSVREESSPSKK